MAVECQQLLWSYLRQIPEVDLGKDQHFILIFGLILSISAIVLLSDSYTEYRLPIHCIYIDCT